MNAATTKLKALSDVLVHEKSTWQQCKKCVEDIHDLFAELGALAVRENATFTEPKSGVGGKAIAPSFAGLCLLDVARTRNFVIGLKNAINHFVTVQPSAAVQVLDAGCGPYGLLPVLCAGFYLPSQVQFTLLDIFEENIASTTQLIRALGYEEYFNEIFVADAVCFEWPKSKPLHILVTETMNRALSKEPQVAITLNLSQYLVPEGILIPTCININLQKLYRPAAQSKSDIHPQEVGTTKPSELMGTVLQLHKKSLRKDIQERPTATIKLPADFNAAKNRLYLITEIQIFEDTWLVSNESAITLPYPVRIPAGPGHFQPKVISFNYNMHGNPGFEWHAT